MGKAEILAELPRLSAEDRAEVQARLDELGRDAGCDASRDAARHARVATPHLADPRQAADFRKQVTELPSDAAL